jgi:hypothetical protein
MSAIPDRWQHARDGQLVFPGFLDHALARRR